MIMRSEERFNRVGVAGDWHGNTSFALDVLKGFAENGITEILHLGDFGVWSDKNGVNYLLTLNTFCVKNNLTIYVTLGNHENYNIVENMVPSPVDGFVYLPAYTNILYATRGARWVWNNVSFLSLGGANSIDRYDRVEWVSWWAGEQITTGDMWRAMEGGYADVMLTHDCPIGVPVLGSQEGQGWSQKGLAYARSSRVALRQVVDKVKPEVLFHGHYHTYVDLYTNLWDEDTEYTLHSIGLNQDTFYNENAGVYDTGSHSFTLLKIPRT